MQVFGILKIFLLPASLRQQQPGVSERTPQSLLRLCRLCIEVGGRSLNIYFHLIRNYNFCFRILRWFCLISSLRQTQFDGPWHCKDTHPTCSFLTINLCFGPSFNLTKFRRGIFQHSVASCSENLRKGTFWKI